MLSPTDERYRAWWPGTHLQFHIVASRTDHVGDLVWMDEYVGSRRLRMTGVVIEAEPGRTIVWQLERWVRLPAVLRLELVDQGGGCLVRHRTEVGYRGIGRIFDPLLRLSVYPRFAAQLDEHVRAEFPKQVEGQAGGIHADGVADRVPPQLVADDGERERALATLISANSTCVSPAA